MELTLTYNEAKEIVKDIIEVGEVPFVKGGPGIGKSALVREVAQELSIELYHLDAPLFQPIDYAIPVPNHETKKIEIYPTGVIPTEGPALVLIDDLPHATNSQQIPLLQICLDKRIANIKLKDVKFIATGNREIDLAGVNSLISPLSSRLVHITIRPDPEEWINWAKRNELSPLITGFIAYKPDLLYQEPQEGMEAWPTPRSWEKASRIISVGKQDEKTIKYKLYGIVGKQAAEYFMSWYKYLQEVDPKAIIEKGQLPSRNDRAFIFAVLQSVAGLIKTKNKNYITQNKNHIRSFFLWLPGEFKAAFLKELIYKKDSTPNISILETVRENVPEVAQYVWDILKS